MALKITALDVGTMHEFPCSFFTYHRNWDKTLNVAMIMFLITGGDYPVIVDTGPSDPEFTKEYHHYNLTQRDDQVPLAALEQAGVDPGDVGLVINTHLHWDHCWNNDLFSNAEFVVQKSELIYAVDPLAPNRTAFERIPGLIPRWVPTLDRTRTVRGDVELLPGLSVVHLPGHTPGSQGVVVQGKHSSYLLAGDCIDIYENWIGDAKLPHIPSGSFTSLDDYMDSFDKMDALGAEVIPSHDPRVIEKGTFG